VACHFGAPHPARTEKEFLDGVPEIIRPVKQHGVDFGQALTDMLGHALTQDLF
jgi:hypothetical protein